MRTGRLAGRPTTQYTAGRMTAPTAPTLDLDGHALPVRIRRSARAGRLSLRLAADGDGVVLVLPAGIAVAEGLRFARSRHDWLRRRLAALRPACLSPMAPWCRYSASATACAIAPRPAAASGSRVMRFMSRAAANTWPAASPTSCAPGRCARHRRAPTPPPADSSASRAGSRCATPPRAGELHGGGRSGLFLAPGAGSRTRLRLRGRPRGGASRRDEPRARVLAAGRESGRRRGGAPRLAAPPRPRPPPLRLMLRSL